MAQSSWTCVHCTFINDRKDEKCKICGGEEPQRLRSPNSIQFASNNECCDNCHIPHTSQQCVNWQKGKPVIAEHKQQMPMNNNANNQPYRGVNISFLKCRGDGCGSIFAKFLEKIVNGPNKDIETEVMEYKDIIIIRFYFLHDELRQSLLKLMRKRGLFNDPQYQQYYNQLNDKTFYVSDTSHVRSIINLFRALKEGDHIDILQQLAFQTCGDPSWSLLEQIIYDPLYTLQADLDSCKRTISMLQRDAKKYEADTEAMRRKRKRNKVAVEEIQEKMKQLLTEIKMKKEEIVKGTTLKRFTKQLAAVKQHRKHKTMQQQQNGELSDLEILSILFYCNADKYCEQMHESHYTEGANSCKWSKLFYYVCSGIDKIWQIFHFKKRGNPKYLFSGSRAHLTDASKHEFHLKTLTSFTPKKGVAKAFAGNKGTIMVIDDARTALKNGSLRGADVSWISQHVHEGEYLILPTTFRGFQYMQMDERVQKGWITLDANYKVYITADVESIHMNSFVSNIEDTFDPPSAWIPHTLPYYDDLRMAFDAILGTMGSALGPFRNMECPQCRVSSAICHYSGNWRDLSVECPSCRSWIVKSRRDMDRYRTFKCHNSECESDMLTPLDLINVSMEEHGLDPNDGKLCSYCHKQQKKIYLEDWATNDEKHDAAAERVINRFNELLYLNCKHGTGETQHVEKSKYKPDVKRIVAFVHQPENLNAGFMGIVQAFPVIWKWISAIKSVKVVLDAYKDGYANLFANGFIDTSNDKEMEKNKYTQIGSVVGKEIRKIESVEQGIDIVSNILSGAGVLLQNDDGDNANDVDDEEGYVENTYDNESDDVMNGRRCYTCNTCGGEIWAKEDEIRICQACVSRNLSQGISLFRNLFSN